MGKTVSKIREEGVYVRELSARDIAIREAIEQAQGSVVQAAKMLGLSTSTVYNNLYRVKQAQWWDDCKRRWAIKKSRARRARYQARLAERKASYM